MRILFLYIAIVAGSVLFGQAKQETAVHSDTLASECIDTDSLSIHINGLDFSKASQIEGMLNGHIHELLIQDTSFNFKTAWKNDVTITYNENPVDQLKDTLWLCVLDSVHNVAVMPVKNASITSHFGIRRGRNHNGTDLDLETGDTVYAAFDGMIRYAKYHRGGFGNLIIVRHFNGLETYYAHLSKLLVKPNTPIKAGDPIGLGGNTGRSTGSHLHFEVRFYDQPIDPELIFDFKKYHIKSENLFVHSGVFEHSRSSRSGASTGGTEAGQKYYRVRSGDTLSAIAARHHTTVSRLCKLNHIKSTSILRIGQSIRLR